MNQGLKFKYDEMKEASPAAKEAQKGKAVYPEGSHVRNLCFVWPDGRRKFLNYAYLVSGDYSPEDGAVTLAFTSETLVIKGLNLDVLFEQILTHIPQIIICIDSRYNSLNRQEEIVINEIVIKNGNKKL